MSTCAFFGQIAIGQYNDLVGADGATDVLTHGMYYVHNPDGGSDDLLTAIATIMTAESSETITLSILDSGYVRISGTGTFSYSLEADLASDLGIASSGSGASSYDGTAVSRYIWLPGQLAQTNSPVGRKAYLEARQMWTESEDGTVMTQRWSLLERCQIDLSYIAQSSMWGVTFGTGEAFYRDIVSKGVAFVFAHDYEHGSTPSDYYKYKAAKDVKFNPVKSIEGSDAYWDWTLPCVGGNL